MTFASSPLSDADFDFVRDFLRTRSGLALTGEKKYLVETRLGPVARRRGVSIETLIAQLRAGRDVEVDKAVVEAMTTNETLFFRDQATFQVFTDVVLPDLVRLQSRSRRLRIWSAACSSGQEPYSVAMRLDDMGLVEQGWNIEIVATDISTEMLERARAGVYSQFEVQRGLPIRILLKYFAQSGERWEIAPAIRNMVTYQPLNLLRNFAALGAFDVILCRNVLIYFDIPTKTSVLNRLSHALNPDGVLMLGTAETVVGLSSALGPHALYKGLYGRQAAKPAAGSSGAPGALSARSGLR